MTRRQRLAALARRGLARRRRGGPNEFGYVALGDSFTAGTGVAPGEGWADRLASWLRGHYSSLRYENLAKDGATSADVLEQVEPALMLEPDLVTVICGANDVLHSVRPDVEGYGARLSAILARLRARVPRVITATSPEHWRFAELRPRTRARVMRGISRLNEVTRSVARARGVSLLDAARHPALNEPQNFAPDGFHPSPAGHAAAATELVRALGARFDIGGSAAPQGRG